MPSFMADRDVVPFPSGNNATDTFIGGSHLNLSTLNFWNYTLYANGTLSNGSSGWCVLAFTPYEPAYIFPNGSFTNKTSCYSPIKPIGIRSYISIALAMLYGFCLLFTLLNLARHGRMYLPVEKRFRPVGRRWQWYWMIAMCSTGFIGLIVNIDVDRYYLPEIPIVITSFFWMLLNLCTLACVWEAVRHWGSWMERQYIDPDPFALAMDDRRAKFEFWVPLFFYFWWWLDFFLVIPRNWGRLELQRTPEQTRTVATPNATDGRAKAGAFMLLACWFTIAVHLRHSINHYRERNRGFFNRAVGLIRLTPFRFQLIVPIALFVVAFQALSAWEFHYSVMDITGDYTSIFAGGYVPALLIMIIQIIAGFVNSNEDQELIRQRRIRGAAADRELGIVRKPHWWRRVNGLVLAGETMQERIARNVREVGGGRATATKINQSIDVRVRELESDNHATVMEMGSMRDNSPNCVGERSRTDIVAPYSGGSDRRRSERTVAHAARLLFPNSENVLVLPTERLSYLKADGSPPPYQGDIQPSPQQSGRLMVGNTAVRRTTAERSGSADTTNSIVHPPQEVRSMLDV